MVNPPLGEGGGGIGNAHKSLITLKGENLLKLDYNVVAMIRGRGEFVL